MSGKIIDGKAIAQDIQAEVTESINIRMRKGKRAPGLATILVGDDPASHVYVRNKRKACDKTGIKSFHYELKADISQRDLFNLIDELNVNSEIDGILVQSPLPKHIDEILVCERILPTKDVDGFHPYSLGKLCQGMPVLRPCTPYGVMLILERSAIDISGKHTVVVGRSKHVGRPLALEMLLAGATTTVCHSLTKNLAQHVRSADVLCAAVGNPNVIPGDWIKPGAIVIDIGITRLKNGKLTGDVNFDEAKQHASFITPVPGGVGPVTVATLMSNTLLAADLAQS
ncbi:MAG: bifunctional methylenetetrahydrofolate dehydrogenase/methenyltetrahydrofolate cyclohydrolase FolD [Rhodospirillaceae bacterium]|nr:bifunctional methylenetetrahydrofolate dehydrogenase/methenyltetrahydrofolate cyclohydrolase FolD [Rhodospirillaceae bacterium]